MHSVLTSLAPMEQKENMPLPALPSLAYNLMEMDFTLGRALCAYWSGISVNVRWDRYADVLRWRGLTPTEELRHQVITLSANFARPDLDRPMARTKFWLREVVDL